MLDRLALVVAALAFIAMLAIVGLGGLLSYSEGTWVFFVGSIVVAGVVWLAGRFLTWLLAGW